MSQDVSTISAQMIIILSDSETYKQFLECRGSVAQNLLDLVQDLLDSFSTPRPLLSRALIRLSHASGLYPRYSTPSGLEIVGPPVAAGAYSDIWRSSVHGQSVAIKVVRKLMGRDENYENNRLEQIILEALIWRQLSHPNLLPFFGLYSLESRLCLVSPWMNNGHILEFLQNASANTDRLSLILDVAMGLEYLHTQQIVHGDLKATNILVTPAGRACIADFGISTIVDTESNDPPGTSPVQHGTLRYQAPEILLGERKTHYGSDVYAFACACYEILTGNIPFFEVSRESLVMFQVINGERPSKPEATVCDPILWILFQDCWQQDPDIRPSTQQIIYRLVNPPIKAKETQSAPDWDETSTAKFRQLLRDRHLLPPIAEIEQIFGDGVSELYSHFAVSQFFVDAEGLKGEEIF
ncbi:kinase-like domain-containing protein [Mycena epipterygia]|nr:kinase-like domain-containing protein [Mycena epipterygia]